MKKNNKGFMMAEVVVVSAIVLVTLVSFYVSYNKIIAAYNQRINYYDVATLYDLANIRDNISDYSDYSSKDAIVNDTYEKVYYLDTIHLKSLDVTNQTFKDYLDYLDNAVTFDSKNILVMEKCINNDVDNCKYAYLESYDLNDTTPPVITFDIINRNAEYYAIVECSDNESGIVGDRIVEKLLEGNSDVIISHTCVNRAGLETTSSHNYKAVCDGEGESVCQTCTIPGQMVCDNYFAHNPNSVGCGGIVGCADCHETAPIYYDCNCTTVCDKYIFEK